MAITEQLPNQTAISEALKRVLTASEKGLHIKAMEEQVASILNLTDSQKSLPHKGARTMLGYKLAWARTKLKKDGVIELAQPSVWRLIKK